MPFHLALGLHPKKRIEDVNTIVIPCEALYMFIHSCGIPSVQNCTKKQQLTFFNYISSTFHTNFEILSSAKRKEPFEISELFRTVTLFFFMEFTVDSVDIVDSLKLVRKHFKLFGFLFVYVSFVFVCFVTFCAIVCACVCLLVCHI